MSRFAADYAIPPKLDALIDAGFLKLVRETPEEKTVEFHIPSRRGRDNKGMMAAYSVVWIHPDHNAEFCRSFVETPGDLPNFSAERQFTGAAARSIDDLNTADDLVDWLSGLRQAARAR